MSSESSSPSASSSTSAGEMESLLSVLVGQVKELKHGLKSIHGDLRSLAKRQKTFEKRHKKLKEKVETALVRNSSEPQSFPSDALRSNQRPRDMSNVSSMSPSLPLSTKKSRAEILDFFPLFKSYSSLYSPDTPFVIDDLTCVLIANLISL